MSSLWFGFDHSEGLVKGEERLLQKSGLADKLRNQPLYVPGSKSLVAFPAADRGYVRRVKNDERA